MDWTIKKSPRGLRGEIIVPPDKSISHRAIMFGSIAKGKFRAKNFLFGEDCMRTYEAFKAMGIGIEREGSDVIIEGKGLKGLSSPGKDLYLGNSGTTMRVISGILAGQDFPVKLTGDESLSSRPMKRIVDPLLEMGANIVSKDGLPPIEIKPASGALKAISYTTPVASAQVKSCILAAGLYASGTTKVTEPYQSRDHTERILEHFSCNIKRERLTTSVEGLEELTPRDIEVPGDISSASYFITAGLLVEDSDIILKKVGINPTRKGIINVLGRMNADIELIEAKGDFEPIADIRVRTSSLKGTTVKKEEIPLLIDEVPILVIAALKAKGKTRIEGIAELKVKESDRIKSMTDNLKRAGVHIEEEEDAIIIPGGVDEIPSSSFESFADHRIAMSMAIAALFSSSECSIKGTECASTSYPDFLRDLEAATSKKC